MEKKPLTMAVDDSQGASAVKPMRLQMPEPRYQSIVPIEHDGLPPEEQDAEGEIEMPEEDARSVVGFSIGRAQTRLTSPQTPAAEKAAAMVGIDVGGLFDGGADEPDRKQGDSDHHHTSPLRSKDDSGAKPSTPIGRPHTANLPSPWRATAKPFERSKTDQHNDQPLEPINMFPDINVRRYLSNFNLPSIPKTPSFRDFSVPSLSSILSNARSRSPLRKNPTRQKRASTYAEPESSSALDRQLERRPTEDRGRGQNDTSAARRTTDWNAASVQGRADVGNRGHQRAASDSVTSPQHPPLRRSTSDQSLLLRRITSTGSSLGDDSRWENVQEQVNSRMKAIKDSLQDSSIKLPSMLNLSGLNLGSFRPDFTRSRAPSEAKQPTHASNVQRNFDTATTLTNGDSEITSRDLQKSSNFEAFQANRKASKATLSCFENALENLTGDIVVIGGYRGSILRSAQPPYRQLWVPVKVGLNIRRVNLEVGLQPEDEENMENHIWASGMLSHIGPVDMGRRLLKRLRTCKNVQENRLRVHDYGYDWRLSPHLLSRRLIAFLEKLECNAPGVPKGERGATIIAHSMGGLITRHAINQRPELFAGVVYAGVPQHCVNILGPLRNGDEVLLSSKVLTAQVNFTLRSSYLLLPDDGKCFINKETKEEYPVDFFDVEQWKKYAWSPCIAPALPPINPPENKTFFGSVTEMLPSMPSLPLPGRKSSGPRPGDDKSNLANAANIASTKIDDLADPTTTRALDPRLSPPSSLSTNGNTPQCTIPLPDAIAYLERTLNDILAFKSQLAHNSCHAAVNAYPPLAVLYANNTPTVAAARVTSRETIKHTDAYDDLQFGSGDGVCLARAAMLPEGYQCAKGGKVRTERGHVGLLGDLEAVGKCLIAVVHERRQGVGLGVQEKTTALIAS